MEIIRADAIARFKKGQGCEVFFNTGTDEHGAKIHERALEAGKDTQSYVDEYAEKFKGLKEVLGLSSDLHFIRTTDSNHKKAAQEFWKQCKEKGFIYKKQYSIKYCVGCELEKTDSELVDGKCPIHPNRDIELIDEENYFFKFSEFQKPLLDLYKKNPTLVIPDFRFNEIKAFVERGLEDFSISRLKTKMPWGVAVPDDSEHVMYVWFDALVNYISTLGWPENKEVFNSFWEEGETVQYAGKDNLRQQSAMWQAMLLAVGIKPTDHIVIDGFVTGEGGIKMSKSLGNVINPYDIVKEYGTDALRYFVLRELNSFEDSPFTVELFKSAYNANLANGIGNLTSRIMKMAETNLDKPPSISPLDLPPDYISSIDNFDLQRVAHITWHYISELDRKIQETQPFKMVKTNPEEAKRIINDLVVGLYLIANMLVPLLPQTSEKIKEAIKANKMPETPLFLRKD
jgi:methionyl-tRNA synthetase